MPLPNNLVDRELQKFLQTPGGDTAVRVSVDGGSSNFPAPTGPFRVTVADVTDTAANPIPTNLTGRVTMSVRNLDTAETIYLGPDTLVTADNTATGGWDIGPGENLNLDLNPSTDLFLIAEATKTVKVKILEIASIGSGGSVTGTEIQEQVIGAINGINVNFLVTQTPLSSGSFKLYLNGLYIPQTEYTRVGLVITMNTAPVSPQELFADYVF